MQLQAPKPFCPDEKVFPLRRPSVGFAEPQAQMSPAPTRVSSRTCVGLRPTGRPSLLSLCRQLKVVSTLFWVQFLIRLIHRELSCPGSATGDQMP